MMIVVHDTIYPVKMNHIHSNQMIKSFVQRNFQKLFHLKVVKYVLVLSIKYIKNALISFHFILRPMCFLSLKKNQIHLKLLEGRPGMKSKVTPTTVFDFTLARYIRLRFQGMHTKKQSVNGIQWIFDRDELKKRSFYSLRYIKIGARLDCNGHAQRPKQYNDNEVSKKIVMITC